ncbi:ATP-binding cassette domain-containing protein [Leifsonia poae]|uniref:ATP-binding cassette domain-containing protein n=1 Tax=Leifsonia poae TaxID=110933 RepID=UPI0027E0C2A1|nr:ATP-binding cassette domain-containing protein [Leifsonia poae]
MTTMAAHAVREARSGSAVLRARGLAVNYGPLAALRDVDLDVYPGEIVGIAGDNGAGKSTLLRCICGDLSATRGEIWLDGEHPAAHPSARTLGTIGVVWQHLALSDNLDVATNLMLGKERRRLLMSESRLHARARAVLDDLGIPIADSTRMVGTLTAAERQLLAVARSVSPPPRLLLLDEPTAVLSRADSAHVEQLILRLRDDGTTILLISHDVDQLFRLTGRVIVLRHGRVVAQVDPAWSHPDELLALMAGHDASSAPRRQLSRLHGLADQLTAAGRLSSAGPSAGLTLILSTLGAALGTQQLSLHVLDGPTLSCVGSVGLSRALDETWRRVPLNATTNGPPPPPSSAVADNVVVVVADVTASEALAPFAPLLRESGIASWWAIPFSSGGDLRGVINIYRPDIGSPDSEELDLVNLYAGYAATALERERLLAELTARNKILETIRAILQTLAGADSLTDRISTALSALREAVGADEVGLYGHADDEGVSCRAFAGSLGSAPSDRLASAVESGLSLLDDRGHAHVSSLADGGSRLLVRVSEATVLAAEWSTRLVGAEDRVLLEDAGHSILLAQEREHIELARREMAALRRSQEMQSQFLARLSHELRTPLTAIHGSASSLMQTDVTWDHDSERRFLSRISGESARLGRLVDDLLDFSMIESGMLRLRPDWVDLSLVVDAALACLSPQAAAAIEVSCADDVPVVWADHDRLEQVMMNLMDNAVRHNPPGTAVRVEVRAEGADDVVIEVVDNGVGMPPRNEGAGPTSAHSWRDRTAGAGLGLSITRGIVDAHHGTLRQHPMEPGTRSVIRLPVESPVLMTEPDDG